MPTVWFEESHRQRPVRVTSVTAPDGDWFRVTRIGEGRGVPVALVPGMFDNRGLYLRPGGRGLADVLAAEGFDVWIVERRGVGRTADPWRARRGWQEAVRVDLPAAQGLISTHTGCSAFWVGHSFGGVALARATATTMQRSQVAGLVLVNAAVDIPLLSNPAISRLLQVRLWGNEFPSRRLRLGSEDEPLAALADAIRWGAAERSSRELSRLLESVDVPVLALTSPRDFIAPAIRCKRLAEAFGGTDVRVQSVARRFGFVRNHGHESPLTDACAANDVFPFVRDWFCTRSGQLASAEFGTADSMARHRLHYTVELGRSPGQLFDVLTHHWSDLWPVRARRLRDGLDPAEPDGLRAVREQRVLGIWPTREEIVTYRAPRLIEYRVTHGPIRNHHGRISLTPTPNGGSRLEYCITFNGTPYLPGCLLVAAIDTTWRLWTLPRLRHTTSEARQARSN